MVWISPEITILKAIHNGNGGRSANFAGVNQSWNYNFESHSQPTKATQQLRRVWISPEITILKAIHNKYYRVLVLPTGVNQSWNYNFIRWSRFSAVLMNLLAVDLKAIHN